MDLTIREVKTGADLDACYCVRIEVFVKEQGVPPWEELDHYDESATHYIADSDGRAVGTARLVDLGDGIGKIGRVAVLSSHRGIGVGRRLVEAALADAGQKFGWAILDAQVNVIPFYEKLGFSAEGPVFLDAGIEHRTMRRRLG